MSSAQVTPEVLWAQRSSKDDPAKNYIYLTISVPDVPPKSLQLKLSETGLVFTGYSDSKKTTYHLELEFFGEIDTENSKTNHTGAKIELVLRKKEAKEEYWPRLLKDKAKVHFLKTDFDKWVDEDEQNEAPEDDYMNNFGAGAGGMGEDGGFGGIDFSKLGAGAGGLPGADDVGEDDVGEDDEGSDDDDEDMPELEEEEEDAKDTSTGKSKVEEVS